MVWLLVVILIDLIVLFPCVLVAMDLGLRVVYSNDAL